MHEKTTIPLNIPRFPKVLHRQVKVLAAKTDRTIKDVIIEAVEEKIDREGSNDF